jgi:hypothetical protein
MPALAVSWDWPVQQLDVKNAFLHGTLNETVFLQSAHMIHRFSSPRFGLPSAQVLVRIKADAPSLVQPVRHLSALPRVY